MSATDWRPTATLEALRARAALNRLIRDFFAARDVLEVETPLLSRHSGSDPYLHPFCAPYQGHPADPGQPHYLQTSPEFAMKRLLAADSGPIYQLGKAFRNGESGSRHNPEFTMLEWYRPGFTLEQLMEEVQALVQAVLDCGAIARLSYAELFARGLGIDPHACTLPILQTLVRERVDAALCLDERDACLDALYSHVLEPALREPVFICDYPASQAALARVVQDEAGHWVARRFELVIGGLELANGYDELSDANEQARRFQADKTRREALGLPPLAGDARLVAALEAGLPPCAGVALGVDRLLMLKCGARTIDDVLAFP
ncbi:MAG TPA: EF-P lysine aminoacylase EpmA, partial [Hyphomicrobiales bacterium]|nr:EF-P lysine aminoacylase EpmA [Hyphomicrobiales bacterium]